jgi:hypothetical protein
METVFGDMRKSCRILRHRVSLAFKALWRDKGSRYSFLSVLLIVGIWTGSELLNMAGDKHYEITSNPNNKILIGVYIGTLFTCAIRIALIDYLVEKRKKMYGFLSCVGLSKRDYFGFHILWNFAISLVLIIPFVLAIGFLINCSLATLAKLLFILLFGSLANSLYIMSMALHFSSEITGLNAIGTFNFCISISSSLIPKDSNWQFLVNSNPQSQLVKLVEQFSMSKTGDLPDEAWHSLKVFCIQILAYFAIFVLMENLSKNEYGYYSAGSLCKKKSKQVSIDPARNNRSSVEVRELIDEEELSTQHHEHSFESASKTGRRSASSQNQYSAGDERR